eukprot:CAMPEP_0176078754 /NCGR_PEP_ID=MMETSP0120_2-20121206/39385_1 /TAXON_ID=160619 /ORGANISM="Kryptoperidinium foliaceum, Strain CCMP 1326" /LENGTH=97 /DNA_ID=CAMNT_0017412503 /DNA_START=27 /DNA_END=320 /DNA_ORIENTATION=+
MAPSDAKAMMKKLMDSVVRISVSDGRMICGQLWCQDNNRNFILLNVGEVRIGEDGEEHRRPLGPLVMVPGKHITKIEAMRAQVDVARHQLQSAAAAA